MDESWRIPIGSAVPRRRSTEQTRRLDVGDLDPDDFRDVFGGPPRTVLLRQFSGGDIASPSSSSSSTASYFDRLHRYHQSGSSQRRPSFYEEVFRRQCPESHQAKIGRRLPDLTIPSATPGGRARRAEDDEFYDIFGWESERRSRTRSRQSKSNSSSVLSSEDHDGGEPVVPHLPWPADDGALTSFASKLRPITIPCRRSDARSPASPEEQISRTTTVSCPRPSLVELGFEEYVVAGTRVDDSCKLFRPYHSETIVSVEWKMPVASDEDGSGSGSPSSVISSIYDFPMATIRPVRENHEKGAPEASRDIVMGLEEEEGEGADGSFVIEIIPGGKAAESEGSSAAAALDEAIAWAKEKSASSAEGIGAGEDQKKHKEDACMHAQWEGLKGVVYHLERWSNRRHSDASTEEEVVRTHRSAHLIDASHTKRESNS
ncbi:hypothetical protein Taro_014169 [Colocasia esculenta]|uniref:Uncharacterized protein n=1 Tax=Colocasia esculenta TaxID=4460 RepID=A0A843UL12_COLES|nr:hypothetical protein [Colocasia esculenta]